MSVSDWHRGYVPLAQMLISIILLQKIAQLAKILCCQTTFVALVGLVDYDRFFCRSRSHAYNMGALYTPNTLLPENLLQ